MTARLHKLLVGLAVAAAVAAPIAAAKAPHAVTVPPELMYIQGPGGNSDLSRFQNFRGGPVGVGAVDTVTAPTAPSDGGFDWADAAVGAGFVAGIALLIAAGLLAWSRRHPLAHA